MKYFLRCYEAYLPMILQGNHASTVKVIILHTLLGLLIFYTVYYMTGSICYGAFRINSFGMLIPFGFKTEPSFSNSSYLANVLAMEITFFISGLLFALLLRWWIWDYAITVTLAHVLLTCAVMKEFPLVWQWWLALGKFFFFSARSAKTKSLLLRRVARLLEYSTSSQFASLETHSPGYWYRKDTCGAYHFSSFSGESLKCLLQPL
ncbi:transmembrane protein 244-like isoform X2 [Varanus komodoensis]|uniref:transmembrane protein 244-like isoform X2 n=1 Tax=Varanus komodoensis TaxID=61221 RepID=UPI001CF7DCD5|nr:transmembrane protein 244-like isoform X2 [Varanus komodoensis]